MTFSIHGLPVARGIAIGRAVVVGSSRMDVAHYFIQASQVPQELERVTNRKSTRLNSSHVRTSRMPSSA